jgi:hypothetical protein
MGMSWNIALGTCPTRNGFIMGAGSLGNIEMKPKPIPLLLLLPALMLLLAACGEDSQPLPAATPTSTQVLLTATPISNVTPIPTATSTPTSTPKTTPMPTHTLMPMVAPTQIAAPAQVPPTPAPTPARPTLTLVGRTTVPDGQIWSAPVWEMGSTLW